MIKTVKSAPITLASTFPLVETTSDYFIPLCPKCGETYTHQGAVHIYDRNAEDAPLGRYVVCSASTATVIHNTPMVDNPSRRRDGLSIEMDCEQCGPVGRLTVFQHKGQTLVGWQK
ncbi:hypothetical protein UFOVP125_35 [uncultured Caudovirales phage]|uniref:Uncharacterized protein n=1 Tax=uncultured Caudovirales phage TaxID=2100421 RepID=A0A6J5LCM6_9CAUD|nr:hypothetical protein UFOVP125_35 [uncultured Caudovirales phage]